MKETERLKGLLRSPQLAWNTLIRGNYDFIYDQMPIRVQNMTLPKRLNLFKAGLNLFRRRSKPWSMPLHMQIEPVNYCNLRCPVCATGAKKVQRPPQNMDLDLFRQVIDEVGPFLLTLSLWGWGESLLHPRFAEILEIVVNREMAVFVSTNGQNLNDPKIIDALLNFPPTHLIVSVDGLTDETLSRFRVGAKLAPILEGIGRLAELKKQKSLRRPVLHMRFMVMSHNQHELPQIEDFARIHGFDLLTVRTLSIVDMPQPDDVHGRFVPDMEQFRAYAYDKENRVHQNDFLCMQPFWFPSVFVDGTVVACEQDYNAQMSLGTLADGSSFKEIWFSRRAAHVRHDILKNAVKPSFCINCPACDRLITDTSLKAIPLKLGSNEPAIID